MSAVENEKPIEISPLRALLAGIELAQKRGAFNMSEMNVILPAYNILNKLETEQNPPTDNSQITNEVVENEVL